MRTLIAIFLIVCFGAIPPLHAALFEGSYVNRSGDTIACQINVKVILFRPSLVNGLSCQKFVKVVHSNGEKEKLYPKEVRSFTILDTAEGDMYFEPKMIDGTLSFVHRIHAGNWKVYRFFYPHGYDGSCQHHFVVEAPDKNPLRLSGMGWRKDILAYSAEHPFFVNEREQKAYKYLDIPTMIADFEHQ